MGYNLLTHDLYWCYNLLTNLLLTSWDIQVYPHLFANLFVQIDATWVGLTCYLSCFTSNIKVESSPWCFRGSFWQAYSLKVKDNSKTWVFPKIVGFPPQIIYFNRVFHYKPSILGYHYFWKHLYSPLDLLVINLYKNNGLWTSRVYLLTGSTTN